MTTRTFLGRSRAHFLAVLILIAGCGGGGGSGGGGGALDGTWHGNLEDPFGDMHTITVTISDNRITTVLNDGIDQGLTGTIERTQGDIWSFELSDGTIGGFIVDADNSHAAFLDEDTNFGAIQKGASALPTFNQTDIGVSASGTIVVLTTSFDLAFVGSSSVTCDGAGNCNGTDNLVGSFTVSSLALTPDGLGRWQGTFNNIGETGQVRVFLTADRTFAASWACPNGFGSFIGDCSFNGWRVN